MTDLTRRTLLAGAAATGALAATASFAQDDKLDTLPDLTERTVCPCRRHGLRYHAQYTAARSG